MPRTVCGVMRITKPGGGSGMGGNFTPGPDVDLGESLEQLGRAALVDRGRSFDDQVVLHPVLIALGLDREGDPRVAFDVADLLIDEQLADHDVVAVQAHPDDA